MRLKKRDGDGKSGPSGSFIKIGFALLCCLVCAVNVQQSVPLTDYGVYVATSISSGTFMELQDAPSLHISRQQQQQQQQPQQQRNVKFDHILPIFPSAVRNKTSATPEAREAALIRFFDSFPDPETGWIDVNALPMGDVAILRDIAIRIMGRPTECALAKVSTSLGTKIPRESDLNYCMWKSDVVSKYALDNFSFEQDHWKWLVRTFELLHAKYPQTAANCLGYLDVGVNVGDGISPIRLLAPQVPIYGIEGSPTTAAIAIANVRTSIEYWKRQEQTKNVSVGDTLILPFSLTSWANVDLLETLGGMCFSRPFFNKGNGETNIGGRRAQYKEICPVGDSAGATTLEQALQSLQSRQQQTVSCSEQTHSWPSIYVAKVDVEGHEFKALSTVVEWLATRPPCYIMTEFWNQPSYGAMVELLLEVGYDQIWPGGEYPGSSPPWWSLQKHGRDTLQIRLDNYAKSKGLRYTELILGRSDHDQCLQRLLGTSPL